MTQSVTVDVRPRNSLLGSLPEEEFQRIAAHLTEVTLEKNQVLHRSNAPASSVYFLDEGVASLSVGNREGGNLELSICGKETTIGERAIFRGGYFIIECSMLTDGKGRKLPPEVFHDEFYRGETLHDLVLNRLEARISETAQTALCNMTHNLDQRLARWILTLSDRSALTSFEFTHEKIAELLAVSRTSVSIEAKKLERKGLIEYTRGVIRIPDTKRLENVTCECYRVIKECIEIYSTLRRR